MPSSLLPLWEKVARIDRCATDEGFVSADRDPSPAFASRSYPLPQGQRVSRCVPDQAVWLEILPVRPGPDDAEHDGADDEGKADGPAANADGADGLAMRLVLRDLAVAGLLLGI